MSRNKHFFIAILLCTLTIRGSCQQNIEKFKFVITDLTKKSYEAVVKIKKAIVGNIEFKHIPVQIDDREWYYFIENKKHLVLGENIRYIIVFSLEICPAEFRLNNYIRLKVEAHDLLGQERLIPLGEYYVDKHTENLIDAIHQSVGQIKSLLGGRKKNSLSIVDDKANYHCETYIELIIGLLRHPALQENFYILRTTSYDGMHMLGNCSGNPSKVQFRFRKGYSIQKRFPAIQCSEVIKSEKILTDYSAQIIKHAH
jgi:hypothetical protein